MPRLKTDSILSGGKSRSPQIHNQHRCMINNWSAGNQKIPNMTKENNEEKRERRKGKKRRGREFQYIFFIEYKHTRHHGRYFFQPATYNASYYLFLKKDEASRNIVSFGSFHDDNLSTYIFLVGWLAKGRRGLPGLIWANKRVTECAWSNSSGTLGRNWRTDLGNLLKSQDGFTDQYESAQIWKGLRDEILDHRNMLFGYIDNGA